MFCIDSVGVVRAWVHVLSGLLPANPQPRAASPYSRVTFAHKLTSFESPRIRSAIVSSTARRFGRFSCRSDPSRDVTPGLIVTNNNMPPVDYNKTRNSQELQRPEVAAPTPPPPVVDPRRNDLTLEKASEAHGVLNDGINPANPNVPRGLSGANMLGLRATENGARLAQRGRGTTAERIARIKGEFLGAAAETVIDDSWEDETGRIKSLAMRRFGDRSARHDFTPPNKQSPLKPLLPLLYTSNGKVAPPYKVMDAKPFSKWLMTDFAQRTQRTSDGIFELEYSDKINISALRSVPPHPTEADGPGLTPHNLGRETWPTQTRHIVDAVTADRSNRSMEPAPHELQNRVRGAKVIEQVDRGEYRIVRCTNGGDMQVRLPGCPPPLSLLLPLAPHATAGARAHAPCWAIAAADPARARLPPQLGPVPRAAHLHDLGMRAAPRRCPCACGSEGAPSFERRTSSAELRGPRRVILPSQPRPSLRMAPSLAGAHAARPGRAPRQ